MTATAETIAAGLVHGPSRRPAFLLITGSRTWTERTTLNVALARACRTAWEAGCGQITVVHGAARGADRLASAWARRHFDEGVTELPVPADWAAPCGPGCRPGHRRPGPRGEFCPTAGLRRNQRMVDLVTAQAERGAWVLGLSFWADPGSRGTRDCCGRAARAAIEMRKFGRFGEW